MPVASPGQVTHASFVNPFGASSVALVILAGVSACVGGYESPGGAGDAGGDASGIDATLDAGGEASGCGQGAICDGTCVDTRSSSENCGACGHACGGGKCQDGACAPVLVASNVAQPRGVAAAGGSVFWLRNGGVERCPVTGCTGGPTVIWNDVALAINQPGGTTIVTDGNQVAWMATGNAGGNGRDIFQCGVVGCVNGFFPKVATGLNDTPTQIAVEGSTLFASQNTGSARQGPLSTLAMLGTGLGSDVPTGIAADASYIYIAGFAQSAAGVDRCTRAATGVCTDRVRLFLGATHIAAAGGFVFATSGDGIKQCAAAGCGGNATVIMPGDKTAAAIAASSSFAAWVNSGSASTADGTVRACALPACTAPRTVATGQEQPVGVTIADGFVYWANRGVGTGSGSIWRAAL